MKNSHKITCFLLIEKRIVKVFIASSDELTPERDKFDSLLILNAIYTPRGIRLEPVRWEYLDSSMGAFAQAGGI